MSGNEAQIAFWNSQAGEGWVRAQASIDLSLAPLSEVAVARAGSQAGEKVLDIGCGCGTTTAALAASGADVTGVDISAPMLAHAATRFADEDNVSFVEADASNHEYRPEYDLVFSRFGVMFFDDPQAAFANIRTALKPGGRLAFLCWQATGMNTWISVPMGAARPFLAPQAPPDPHAPGPFAFADRDRVEDILAEAGFTNIRFDSVVRPFTLGKDLDGAILAQRQSGPLGRVIAELDEETREAALAAIREALEPHLTERGVELEGAAWLVEADNP